MTRDSDQCERMASEAAERAAARGGISIEIRLLCADGFHLWTYSGDMPAAMSDLAAAEPQGGTQ